MRNFTIAGASRAANRLVRRLARSDSGNVAIIFGFTLIPMLVAVGGAVDYSRVLLAEHRLGAAIDAAALAAGSLEGSTEEEMAAAAQAALYQPAEIPFR